MRTEVEAKNVDLALTMEEMLEEAAREHVILEEKEKALNSTIAERDALQARYSGVDCSFI